MDVLRVIGNRRSVRYLDPDRPVERAKLQVMLEAARRCSSWGNIQALRAVVVERATADPEVMAALEGVIGAFQVNIAPVVIVWSVDDHAIEEQPDRLREIIAARAMGIDEQETRDHLENTLLPFFDRVMDSLRASGLTEMDCGQGIAQATLAAFDQGLATCLIGGARLKKTRAMLGLPESHRVLVMQTVGYPAEDYIASGQRPRLPFGTLYKLNHFATEYPVDDAVTAQLEAAGLIQHVGPVDRIARDKELADLRERYQLPPY